MKAKACKAKGKHSNSSKRGTKIAARGGAEGMEIVNPHAGGIDCGAQEHYVAVPPQSVEPGEPVVRCFSAFTEGLDALVEWLKACGVTTVAIESTGVYWIALCQKLEAAASRCFWSMPGTYATFPDARLTLRTASGSNGSTASGY